MENKNRGFHVTIVNNNTGETIVDADTQGILYAMLYDTEKSRKMIEEAKLDFVVTVGCGRHMDNINPVQLHGLIGRLQWIIQTEWEENPILQIVQMIMDEKSVAIVGDDEEDNYDTRL